MGSWFCLLMWSPTGSGGVFGVSGGQTELRELLPTGCVARDLMGTETSTGVPSNSSHGTLTSHTGCMNKSWSYLRGKAGGCFSFWLLSPLFSVLFAYLNLERKPLFIKAKSAMACMVQNQLSLKICARPFPSLSSISPLGPLVVKTTIYSSIDLLYWKGEGFPCGLCLFLGWLQLLL